MTLKINFKNIIEKFLWFLTTFMFVSLYMFSTYSWGKYVLALCSTFIFVFGVLLQRGLSYKIKINMFHIIQIFFCIYCLFSCTWSINQSYTFSRTLTMLQILLFYSMLMSYYIQFDSIENLLNILMWAGYAVAIYTFIYYGGISAILDLLKSSQRIQNDFANSNSIGMLCAITCILQLHKILFDKKYYSAIFMIPTIIILAICQSRKSIIMLILGCIAVIIFKNANKKRILISLFKIIISLILLYFTLKYILNLDIFTGMNRRLVGLLSSFTGYGVVDNSTSLRNQFIEIGYDYFWSRPFLGYGFNSSGTILFKETSHDTYFHNNYIELLVNGGIIGLFLYYFNYLYLLFNYIKLRNFSKKKSDICIIILCIILIMDYGQVSYYDKSQYFYFMICYVQVEILKRERQKFLNEITSSIQETM